MCLVGVNHKRENTLNSLLVEMVGFSTNSGVIVIRDTNIEYVLVLLSLGRFDRQFTIDNPNVVYRLAII